MATCSLHKKEGLREEIFKIFYESELRIRASLNLEDEEAARNAAEKVADRVVRNLTLLESQPQG